MMSRGCNSEQMAIREIEDDDELRGSVAVIRNSFVTVANDLNLNAENCPTHPAFISFERLKKSKEEAETFGLFHNDQQVGFVAVEKMSDTLYYMKKLAILPEYRHRGFGKRLIDFVFDYAEQQNGETISIGVINENSILKKWYSDYGFVETSIKQFEHLPFEVCFMEKGVESCRR